MKFALVRAAQHPEGDGYPIQADILWILHFATLRSE